jgi:hypothetical protein
MVAHSRPTAVTTQVNRKATARIGRRNPTEIAVGEATRQNV